MLQIAAQQKDPATREKYFAYTLGWLTHNYLDVYEHAVVNQYGGYYAVNHDRHKDLEMFESSHVLATLENPSKDENGWGVPVDYSESGRWYHMAAEGGHQGAKGRLLEFPSINILGSDIHQARLKAGDKVKLNLLWEILRLPADQTVPVQIERQLFLDGKPLFSTPRIETLHKGTGRHTTEFEFPVPPSAQPGTYVFETTVRGLGTTTKKETLFVIGQ